MGRKKYSNEFKQEAVKLVLEQGVKVSEAARDLGLKDNTLHNWLSKAKSGMLDPSSPKVQEHEELKKLRKEISRLKQEREILKKAATYFAKISG